MPAKSYQLLLAALLTSSGFVANADLVITAEEVGGDVVFTHNGSLNIDSLGSFLTSPGFNWATLLAPSSASIVINNSNFGDYKQLGPNSLSGPNSFGSGGTVTPDSSGGDFFGLIGNIGTGYFILDNNYNTDDVISGSMTFNGTDFTTLGINNSQSYVWTVQNAAAETITLNFIPTAVPIGSTLSLSTFGLMALVLVKRRKKRG